MSYTLNVTPFDGFFDYNATESTLSGNITHHYLSMDYRMGTTGTWIYVGKSSNVTSSTVASMSGTKTGIGTGTFQVRLRSRRTEYDNDIGNSYYYTLLTERTIVTFTENNGFWGNPYYSTRTSTTLNTTHRTFTNTGLSPEFPTATMNIVMLQLLIGGVWTNKGYLLTHNPPTGNVTTSGLSASGLTPATTYSARTRLYVEDGNSSKYYYSPTVAMATLATPVPTGTVTLNVSAHNGTHFTVSASATSVGASHSYNDHLLHIERKLSNGTWVLVRNGPTTSASSSVLPNYLYAVPKGETAQTIEFRAFVTVRVENTAYMDTGHTYKNGTVAALPARTASAIIDIDVVSTYSGSELGQTVTGNFSNVAVSRGSVTNYTMRIAYKIAGGSWDYTPYYSVASSGANASRSVFFAAPQNGETWDYAIQALVMDDLGNQYSTQWEYQNGNLCQTPTPPTGNWRAVPTSNSLTYSNRIARLQGVWPNTFSVEGSGDATGFGSSAAYFQRLAPGGSWTTIANLGTVANGTAFDLSDNLDGFPSGNYSYRTRFDYYLLNNQTHYGSYIEYSQPIKTTYHEGDDSTVTQVASATLNRTTANQQDTVSLNATLKNSTSSGVTQNYNSVWKVYNASTNALIATLSDSNFSTVNSTHNITHTPTSGLAVYYTHTETVHVIYAGRSSYPTNTWQSATITGKIPVTYSATATWGTVTIANGAMTREVTLGGIVGAYQTVTNVDQTLYWKPVGGSYTSVGTYYSNVPGAMSGTTSALVDTQTQYWYISTRVRGTYYGVAFDQTFSTAVSSIVYNAANTGAFVHNFILDIAPSPGPNTKIDGKINSITRNGGVGGLVGYSDSTISFQRRVSPSGGWSTLSTVSTTVGANKTYYDGTGVIGTTYDYRVAATSTATVETGDGEFTDTTFTTEADHKTLVFQNVFTDLLVTDYVAVVEGHFTLGHTYTSPTASNKQFKRYEWTPSGVSEWASYSSVVGLPRAQRLESRVVFGRTTGTDEQVSNSAPFVLSTPPKSVTSLLGTGTYAGNRISWSSTDTSAYVEVKRGGTVVVLLPPGSDSTFTDGGAVANTNYTYYVSQYYEDAGSRLYSGAVSTTSTRPATPPLPSYPVVDSAAYIGHATNGDPIIHLAPTGTSLTDLKSPTALSTSLMHSSSKTVVVTDIKTVSNGILDAATKTLLATRSYMTVLLDLNGAVISGDMFLSKSSSDHYGEVSASNTFSSGITFGSGGSAYYTGESGITLPSWAQSIKFYFLNITNNGVYIDPRDASTDILLSKDNFKIRGQGLDNAKLLCSIGVQTDSTVVTALNYQDDIIPFKGAQIYGNTYSGVFEDAIQVLGSAASVGWDITPKKGRIDRVLPNGDRAPWWNAGYGKTRMEYIGTVSHDVPRTTISIPLPDTVLQPSGVYEATFSGSTTGIGVGSAEILLPLPATHVTGDFYGVAVTPTGTDTFTGGVEEFYTEGKGTLNWSNFNSANRAVRYTRTKFFVYNLAPGEPEVETIVLSHTMYLTKVGSNLRLSIVWEGALEGQSWGSSETLNVAPIKINIIQMR